MSVFKAYDIRGVVGSELTDELAHAIGRAFASEFRPRTVAVARDMRPHSPGLASALIAGLRLQGVEVIDLGRTSTPMCYFANGSLKMDASIMITASHNPGEYNGFKLCRAGGVPISGATGIRDLERRVNESDFDPPAEKEGGLRQVDIAPAYAEHVRSFVEPGRPLRLCIDYANAMGIAEGAVLRELYDHEELFADYDGTFPNHEANPLDLETFHALCSKVKTGDYDFGIAFDGDADRVGFVDERGDIISMDLITALIAQSLLRRQPGVVFYDLRSSRAVPEAIGEAGGEARMCRVGHAFIKAQMREANAIFAGELSGHYYFRENYFTESAALAVVYIANLLRQSDQTLSQWVAPLRRYAASGEINSRVRDPARVFASLRAAFPCARSHELDGLSLELEDFWFNVRMSNTEPLCRLNLEAPTPEIMAEKRDQVLGIIRGC